LTYSQHDNMYITWTSG